MMRSARSEQGAVALLTTVIIGILLTIITTGLVSLMISELRQSNDAEQSVRAYYAAQSGVEEGIEKVIAGLGSAQVDQLCNTAGSKNLNLDPSNPGAVGWTCQQITYSGSPTGSLPLPDKAVQLDLGSAKFGSMIMEWDITPPPPGGYPAGFFDAPLGNFPSTAVGWNHPAAMEVAFITYPDTAFEAETAGAIILRNALVVPRTSGGGPYNANSLRGSNPLAGICNPAAGSYHCRVVIDNLNPGNRNTMLRVRSRYAGSDYKLTFTAGNNGAGAVVKVPDGTATIDITAKAGDAFRRVIYKVPYRNGAASGLDYVIYSDTDVCKNFSTLNGAVLDTGCPY